MRIPGREGSHGSYRGEILAADPAGDAPFDAAR
jgi:hypothetical protein